MTINTVTTVEIIKPLFGGMGLGRHNGKVLMVRGAYPGETVRARVTAGFRDYTICDIEEIVTASPARITPACENFGACGGCDHLDIRQEFERKIKSEILKETLIRITRLASGDIPEPELLESPRFGYRSIADVQFSGGSAGFFGRGTHRTVPFAGGGCPLLAEELREGIPALKGLSGRVRVACDHLGGFHVQGDGSSVREMENGLLYEREINSFFQVNRLIRSPLQDMAYRFSGARGSELMLEIGCGVGFFSLYFAQKSVRTLGIDISRKSVEWAIKNAAANGMGDVDGLRNVKFRVCAAERFRYEGKKPDILLIDPPRSGLSAAARERAAALSAGTVVYISCNPATFSRDAARFIAAGYRLARLAIVEMFPGTHHIELMGRMEKT